MKRFFDTFLAVAILLSFVVACSGNTSSVDSQDEHAPGQTGSLSVGIVRPAGLSVSVYHVEVVNERTVVLDSVIVPFTKSRLSYLLDTQTPDTVITFNKVSYGNFGIVAVAQDEKEGHTYAAILTDEAFLHHETWDDTSFNFCDSLNLKLLKRVADIQLSVDGFDFALGDSICIAGTLSCGAYDKAAQKSGFIQIKNVPASTPSMDYMDYRQIEIIRGIKVFKDSVYWKVSPGGTQVANRNVVAKVIAELNVELPAMDILNKLKDKTLDSMLFRYRRARVSSDDNICIGGRIDENLFFMDSRKNVLPKAGSDHGVSDSVTYWTTLPPIKSAAKILYTNGYAYHSEFNRGRVVASAPRMVLGDIVYRNIFSEDSSLAISFWIEADGKQGSEGERHSVLVAGKDSLRFEIAQCEKESQFVCATVVDRRDSASGDREPLGKVEILDGKAHHVSFVIHKNLFVIALDGVTVHESDVEFLQGFYGISNVYTGDYPLTDYVQYSFGDFIRKAGEKDWTRLKAWLQAFYLLQVE